MDYRQICVLWCPFNASRVSSDMCYVTCRTLATPVAGPVPLCPCSGNLGPIRRGILRDECSLLATIFDFHTRPARFDSFSLSHPRPDAGPDHKLVLAVMRVTNATGSA